jgi:hypothetical protein
MVKKFDEIPVTLITHDGRPNPNNPFDKLPETERLARIRRALARIAIAHTDVLQGRDHDSGLSGELNRPKRILRNR